MTGRLISSESDALELEAFVERVAPAALASGALQTSIDRAIEELSVDFNSGWPQQEKLAWLFVANLGSCDVNARERELRRVRDALGAAISASPTPSQVGFQVSSVPVSA